MSTAADLLDLNVWFALTWPGHSHHRQAVHYWEQQAAEQVNRCCSARSPLWDWCAW